MNILRLEYIYNHAQSIKIFMNTKANKDIHKCKNNKILLILGSETDITKIIQK